MEEIYVIGCGPSMKKFNWELLRNLPTIAVNGSIVDVPEPDYFLTACSGFSLNAFRQGFWNTKARKVLIMGEDHFNYTKIKPFIHMFDEVHKPYRFDGEIGFEWEHFATGQNSGFCAMQYAVLRGARKIHLVGMDLTGSGHYYSSNGSGPRAINNFYGHFVHGIQILLSNGILVISRTKESRLNNIIPYEAL